MVILAMPSPILGREPMLHTAYAAAPWRFTHMLHRNLRHTCISSVNTASTETIDAAMRADFESLPPELRVKFLYMLCASGCMTPEFWWDVLVSDNRSRTDADFAI